MKQWWDHSKFGFWDMGKPRIPPLPQAILMWDRSLAQYMLVSHTGEGLNLSFFADPAGYNGTDKLAYGPYDGPYLPDGWRLYLEEGALLGEAYTRDGAGREFSSPRVLTRRGNETTLVEIVAKSVEVPGVWPGYNNLIVTL